MPLDHGGSCALSFEKLDLGISLANQGLGGAECIDEAAADFGGQKKHAEDAQSVDASSQSKGKAKAKGKSGGSHCKGAQMCELCQPVKDDFGKKTYCRRCMQDYKCAERRAKADKQLPFFKGLAADVEKLRRFLSEYRSEAGGAHGTGNRRGGFNWVRYTAKVAKQVGVRRGGRILQKTEKEFVDIMKSCGSIVEWALAEFRRRRCDPARETGIDPDTKLPTVECMESSYRDEYEDNFRSDIVGAATRERKTPKSNDFTVFAGQLGARLRYGRREAGVGGRRLGRRIGRRIVGRGCGCCKGRSISEGVL